MDWKEAKDHIPTLDRRVKLAEDYQEACEKAYEAHHDMDIHLVANFKKIRVDKPNVGIDTAYIMLMEICPEAKKNYYDWKKWESKYKGLEKLIASLEHKTTFVQSLMRYHRDNG